MHLKVNLKGVTYDKPFLFLLFMVYLGIVSPSRETRLVECTLCVCDNPVTGSEFLSYEEAYFSMFMHYMGFLLLTAFQVKAQTTSALKFASFPVHSFL